MGLADTVTKAYMKDNSVFADAFNYLIYGGEAVVDPKQLQELDTTEIALPFGSQDEDGKQPEEAVQKYRDVLKSAIIKQIAVASIFLDSTKKIRLLLLSRWCCTLAQMNGMGRCHSMR